MAQPAVVVQGVVVGKATQHHGNALQEAAWDRGRNRGVASASGTSPAFNSLDVSGGNNDVLQLSCRSEHLPPSIRLDFIKKVYGILGLLLLVTFGIAVPFVIAPSLTVGWFLEHAWVLWIVISILIAQYAFDMCMACEMCCGGSSLLRGYLAMMSKVPWNFVYLITFASCFGVVVGFLCAMYTAESVLLVFALSFALIVALTVYAVRTKADFTGCGAYIMVLFLGLVLMMLVWVLFPGSVVAYKIVAGAGATIFGCMIVYDTQQIFGSASSYFGGGARELELTTDMYAFAAWKLYLDFINFFVYMLALLGQRE